MKKNESEFMKPECSNCYETVHIQITQLSQTRTQYKCLTCGNLWESEVV